MSRIPSRLGMLILLLASVGEPLAAANAAWLGLVVTYPRVEVVRP